MDQLMQFISASITDMTRGDRLLAAASAGSTSKPYKCALLDDRTHSPPSSDATSAAAAAAAAAANAAAASAGASAVAPMANANAATTTMAGGHHGHHICTKHEESNKDIVQQSQVSSTRSPSVLANDIIGPLLLEALDGFLFMVDSMGKIQFISENVTQYLKYTKDDLIGNNIYNLVHNEDFSHFTKSLELLSKESTSKSRTFSCRMNVKPPGEERDPCYDNMQITAILQPHPGDADSDKSSRCLLACIARRVGCVEKSTTSLGIEKFTTKQDLKGKILACDTSGGQKSGSHSYSKLIGENVQDFCHGNDRPQLLKHHREVIMNGSNTSGVYRFRLHENRYVFVQTKSKLFKNPMNGNPEFIMSTHSIVRECDTESELKGSASSCLMKAIIGNSGSKLSKDRIDMTSNKSRQMAASTQPQSTMFDLEDLLNDPRLNFGDIADDSSFCDIPDLPNSTHWTSLSDLSLDKGLASCPGSPMGSIPVLSPATSASRSPRMGSVVQQGWMPKECRPPKQGRGRPRSSKKPAAGDRVPSWTPSTMNAGSGAIGQGSHGHGVFNVPAVTSQHDSKSKKNLINPRSVGSYSSAGPSLTDSWENLYSSPSSVDHFSTHSSKKSGFPEVGLIQQMRQLQKTSRQRTFSGSSSTSASWIEKLPPSIRGGNKNAHLLDLLMRDDDEEEDVSAFLLSPTVHHEGQSTKTTTPMKSEHSDSETATGPIGSCGQPLLQPKQENEDEAPKCPPAKKPAMQNVILKQLLSQVDEDSQPFKCDLKLLPAESGTSREVAQVDVASQLASADSSAIQSVPSTDISSLNASNEAEPKKEDDILLKQLLNKEESFGQSRSSSPELLKSLLSNDDTSVQPAEAHSSETEVASSGLSSPVAMEMSLSDHLNEFLSGGVKRKVTEVEDPTSNPAPFKFPNRSVSLTEDATNRRGDARGSKRKASGSTGPSKKNILLAQLLSKQVDSDPMVNIKNPSAIATVTPLMQMLQQSTGKTDEPTTQNRETQDPSSIPTYENNAETELTQLAEDSGSTEVPCVTKVRSLSCPDDIPNGDARSHDALGLDEESDCLGLKDWENYGLGDLSPSAKCDDSTLKEFIQNMKTEDGIQESNQRQDSAPADDLDRDSPNSPSEEDKKLLAELEEALESSRFTMEDLNSMLGISSGHVLEPTKHSTKSAINALEEQVSRIDSDLKLQVGIDDRDGPDRGRAMAGHGWPGKEMADLGLLSDFDDMVAASGQRYPQMQGYPKRMAESSALHPSNMFDPMTRPASSTSVASLPAYQRQALQQQQMFAQGQLQVNKPVLPSAVSEQGVEAVNSNREEIFGDYTPISPALQDDVFSPGEAFGFPQMTNGDLLQRSSTSYPGTPMSGLCSLEPSQACSPKIGPMSGSSRGHSAQVNQFGPFFGGNLPFQSGMRESSERKRSRFGEHMNPGVNSTMNPVMSGTLAESGSGEFGMFANQRNFNVMNQGGWNPMHVGQPDGNLMVDQRTVAQFNQTRLNLMSGSRVNEPSKTGSPFYGPTMNPVRQGFKGSVNQMNANETMNPAQMNLGQMSQMSGAQMSMNQMNQMNQMNIGQMNQINIRQMNQINVGQINQINVGQVNQINVGQMSPMGMGPVNQINMGQMNLGQMNMNLGQMKAMNMGQMGHFDRMNRNAFNSKTAASPEEFSHPVKTSKGASHGSLDPVSMVDRMPSSRSKGHRGHLDFLPGSQSQVMDAAMMQPQQRMNAAGMMNPAGLGMNFESIGMGIDSSHMGHGETGVMGQTGIMGQVPHPGLGRMTHTGGMGSMNHPGLGHKNHMGSGGLMPCVDPTNPAAMKAASMNRMGHPHPMNHPGQANHLHQMNLPCQTKPNSSAVHGFMRPMDLPGFGQSPMGQPQLGQSPMGQSPMGQPQMSQPTLERVSQAGGMHGVTSSGFESPPEISMEDIFQPKTICDSDQFPGASVGGQPSVFGEGRLGSYRMSSDRQNLQSQSNVFTPEQQRHLSAQASQDPMLLSPISNHSASLEGGTTSKNANIGRQGTSREAGKTVQRSMSEMSGVKETSSTREYIKQELRNMCTARAQQGQSLQQQMHHHQHLQPQQQAQSAASRLSSVPGFDDEIPLDILESINEITKAQEKQQKLMTHNSNQPTSFEQAMASRPQSKSRDPLLFTGENSHDPLGSDHFWDPLGGDELTEVQNPILSFDGLFEPHLDSSRMLPKMPVNARMLKSGSLLQKLLSDTT